MGNEQKDEHVQATFGENPNETANQYNSTIHLLTPRDVFDTLERVKTEEIEPQAIILDPWYNRGDGEIMKEDDYFEFISNLLESSYELSNQVYLWGYPDMIWRTLLDLPKDMELIEWLTWHYKNRPAVDKGWRSSQFTCLHLGSPDTELHPEHFLTEEQLKKKEEGTLRYMPGPSSVIEASLPIGFVKQDEQTDHPSQKPKEAIEPLVKMATKPGELVLDPMAGSGTTGAVCKELGRDAIIADKSEDYTQMMENRLEISAESTIQ